MAGASMTSRETSTLGGVGDSLSAVSRPGWAAQAQNAENARATLLEASNDNTPPPPGWPNGSNRR